MDPVSIYEIIGVWVSIFLTLTVFSFLYDDNPIYKLSEHIFMGVTIGYGISESYWGVFKPNLIDKLFVFEQEKYTGESIYFIALFLCILLRVVYLRDIDFVNMIFFFQHYRNIEFLFFTR